MVKKDLIIYIDSSGPNVFFDNIEETIKTISENIINCDYQFYFSVDSENTKEFLVNYFGKSNKLLAVRQSEDSWAKNFNKFFKENHSKTTSLLISHDDIILNSKIDYKKIYENFLKHEKTGWLTFTNDKYYKVNKIPVANSVREGFHKDRKNSPRVHECHKFSVNESIKIKKLDFPKRAVKCHGVYSHFNMISVKSLKLIGDCADWTKYTMFIDEDWSLEALKNNLWNVWLPNVFYTHPNPKNVLKRKGDLRYLKEATNKFYKKWGFDPTVNEYDEKTVESIRSRYAKTNIPGS